MDDVRELLEEAVGEFTPGGRGPDGVADRGRRRRARSRLTAAAVATVVATAGIALAVWTFSSGSPVASPSHAPDGQSERRPDGHTEHGSCALPSSRRHASRAGPASTCLHPGTCRTYWRAWTRCRTRMHGRWAGRHRFRRRGCRLAHRAHTDRRRRSSSSRSRCTGTGALERGGRAERGRAPSGLRHRRWAAFGCWRSLRSRRTTRGRSAADRDRSSSTGTGQLVDRPEPRREPRRRGAGRCRGLRTDDVWAIGSGGDNGDIGPVIEHWDGASWSVTPTPPVDTRYSELNGVSALSPDDAWAVGQEWNRPLALHWDGTSWTKVTVPNIRAIRLGGVVQLAPDDAWAAGTDYANLNGADPARAVLAHWDGSNWSLVPTPLAITPTRPSTTSRPRGRRTSGRGAAWPQPTTRLEPPRCSTSTGRRGSTSTRPRTRRDRLVVGHRRGARRFGLACRLDDRARRVLRDEPVPGAFLQRVARM